MHCVQVKHSAKVSNCICFHNRWASKMDTPMSHALITVSLLPRGRRQTPTGGMHHSLSSQVTYLLHHHVSLVCTPVLLKTEKEHAHSLASTQQLWLPRDFPEPLWAPPLSHPSRKHLYTYVQLPAAYPQLLKLLTDRHIERSNRRKMGQKPGQEGNN